MDEPPPLALPRWFADRYRNCVLRLRNANRSAFTEPHAVRHRALDHWCLFVVREGMLRLRGFCFDLTLPRGHATLVPSGCGFQEESSDDGWRGWEVNFDIQTVAQAADPLATLDLPRPLPCSPGVLEACERLVDWIGGQPRPRGVGAIRGRIELDGILLELLGSGYAAGLLRESRQGPAPAWLHAVVEHLERRFKPADSVPQVLTKISGYSADYVRHMFVRHFGETPERFQRKVRVGLSTRMLRSNAEMTIGEVAQRCGYDNYAQFARDFSRLIGTSPRAWRGRPASDGAVSKAVRDRRPWRWD